MATKHPRILVTVDEELADAIRRIGKATGMSQSGTIGWVLNAQRQTLLELADVVTLAAKVSGSASRALKVQLTAMEADVKAAADQARGQLDAARALIEEAQERDQLSAARVAELAVEDPLPPIRLPAGKGGQGFPQRSEDNP